MEILIVTAELAPWVSATDGSTVAQGLAKSLRQLGHEVVVMAPYSQAYEAAQLMLARRLSPLDLSGGRHVTVYDAQLATGANLILLGPSDGDPVRLLPERSFSIESARAAAIFAQAVAALVQQREEQSRSFDVIQVMGCGVALVGLALRQRLRETMPPVVQWLEDIELGGYLAGEPARELGHQPDLLEDASLATPAGPCLLAAGLSVASTVVVPSEAYAAFLLSDDSTSPLKSKLAELGVPLVGILPGVDYSECNPATDPFLVARYDAEASDAKSASRRQLMESCGLDAPDRPLLLVPGPLSRPSGGVEALEVISRLLHREMAWVVLGGRGDEPDLVGRLPSLVEAAPSDVAWFPNAEPGLTHRAFAAADLVILPSRHQPGGWRHLFAQRYGAAPVARAVGGLLDGIVDADNDLETGSGFLYDEPTTEALFSAVLRAVAGARSPNFSSLRRRLMRRDVGWDRPARRFEQIYRKLKDPS